MLLLVATAAPAARAAAPDATATAETPAAAPATQTAAKAPPPYNYAPDDCEFRMVFPGEPEQVKRCSKDDPNKCNNSTSFTHVFDMSASVNITVTCLPAAAGMYGKYSGPVMQQTLSMVSKNKLDKYETGYQQYDVAKQATVLGTGKAGASDMVYIAQLWIGHHSVFTVEGSMIGDQRDDADKMFTDILKSIRHKDWKLGPNGLPIIPPGSVVQTAPPPAAPQQEPSAGPPMPAPDSAAPVK
jgi:hypothetical protein